jgi:CubicO group peptidase (beta-lactamase class C family)
MTKLTAFLCTCVCLATPAAAAELPSDAEILQMLSMRVDLQKGATGIVEGITSPHGHHIVAYGTRGLEDKRPVGGNTVYDVGSITKVFTAALLADMIRRHEMTLDQPAQTLLPPGRVTMPVFQGKQITLADLGTHTAGLPLRPGNLPSKDPVNPYAGYTEDELFEFLSSFKLKQAPGTSYEYSNVGYGLLGLVLSFREKADYADLVARRITTPLGMSDTRIVPTDSMRSREADPYDADLKQLPHEDGGVLVAAGAYRSTANDLLKFLDAVLGLKRSSLKPVLDDMVRARRPGGMQPSTSIALAWNIKDDGGREIVWKNGSVNGYRAFIGYDAKARLGVVALANAQTGDGADLIGLHLLDPDIAVNMFVPAAHREIVLSPEALDKFVGVYRFSPTDILTVTRNGDHLHCTEPGWGEIEMFAESDGKFFLKAAPAEITFSDISDGHAARVLWHQAGPDETGERIK